MTEKTQKIQKREVKKTYAIRLKPSVVEKLDKAARGVHRDRSNMIEHIVNQYLDNKIEDWSGLVGMFKNVKVCSNEKGGGI